MTFGTIPFYNYFFSCSFNTFPSGRVNSASFPFPINGACASACHEGAIAMIDGKARLIKDDYCDGLGAVSYTHLDVYKRQA